MQRDIRRLRIRFVITVTIIVTVIMGCIFGVLCELIKASLSHALMSPYARYVIMRDVRFGSAMICIIGIALFTAIAIILSKWVVGPVEKSWQNQKQFVSDASHELKTPLTVITTNAEMLMAPDTSDDDKQKYTNNIFTVSHQMKDLVENMLNLSRIEKGEEAFFEKFNLSETYSEAILQFEPVYYELGLNLVESIDPNIFVKGSKQRLIQLLVILLDNASKYSKPGNVVVKLTQQGKNAALSIENPADYISEDQLSKLFKRFYRTDESHHAKGSFGLGLSIAQSICESHKGRISAEYHNDKIVFTALIPLTL